MDGQIFCCVLCTHVCQNTWTVTAADWLPCLPKVFSNFPSNLIPYFLIKAKFTLVKSRVMQPEIIQQCCLQLPCWFKTFFGVTLQLFQLQSHSLHRQQPRNLGCHWEWMAPEARLAHTWSCGLLHDPRSLKCELGLKDSGLILWILAWCITS